MVSHFGVSCANCKRFLISKSRCSRYCTPRALARVEHDIMNIALIIANGIGQTLQNIPAACSGLSSLVESLAFAL